MAGHNYEDRLIMFIDFLGFKEVVGRTAKNPINLDHLVKAIDKLVEIVDDDLIKSQQITQFSDSLVVSYRIDEHSGVFWMLDNLAMCIVEMAGRGYLVRGAITFGKLLHSEKYLVGPAMVKAYEMESKLARFPRVLVDPRILSIAGSYHAANHTPKEEKKYVKSLISRDVDGLYYIDYVSWKSVVEVIGATDDQYPSYLKQLAKQIRKGLNHSDVSVLTKYVWLQKKYSDARHAFVSLHSDHPYRKQSQDNCDVIEALPSFNALALKANTQIAKKMKKEKLQVRKR